MLNLGRVKLVKLAKSIVSALNQCNLLHHSKGFLIKHITIKYREHVRPFHTFTINCRRAAKMCLKSYEKKLVQIWQWNSHIRILRSLFFRNVTHMTPRWTTKRIWILFCAWRIDKSLKPSIYGILDFEHKGYLASFILNYFFKGIQEQILAHLAEKVNFQDVKDEIFDMIKPADPLKDMINSGQGDTMVSILIEFHKFWAYENREIMVVESTNIEENCVSP